MIRRTLFLSLLLVVGCAREAPGPVDGHGHEHGHEHGDGHSHSHADAPTAEVASAVCPPCRMTAQAHFETIEAGGLRFSVCNPRCAEIVRKDPAQFTADALP